MFLKEQRLGRTAFAHVYSRGRKVHLPGLIFIYVAAPTLKVAAVVGKKVATGAVARNLIRRRLYAAVRAAEVTVGHIIMVAKPAARANSYRQLCAEVITAIERLGVGASGHSR